LDFGKPNNVEEFEYDNKNFRIEKTGAVYTVPIKKHFQPRMNKGNVDDQYKVRPFGYADPALCGPQCSCKNFPQ
jgi:hypothetical protein